MDPLWIRGRKRRPLSRYRPPATPAAAAPPVLGRACHYTTHRSQTHRGPSKILALPAPSLKDRALIRRCDVSDDVRRASPNAANHRNENPSPLVRDRSRVGVAAVGSNF